VIVVLHNYYLINYNEQWNQCSPAPGAQVLYHSIIIINILFLALGMGSNGAPCNLLPVSRVTRVH
jgi:hypothetical protein